MSANTPATAQGETATDELSSSRGRRRKLITALMILAFLAIIAIALYALSLIAGAVILLLVSALLAYIIYPLVQLLQRRLRRSLAITVAYLLIAVALAGGMFIVTSSLIGQSTSIAQSIQVNTPLSTGAPEGDGDQSTAANLSSPARPKTMLTSRCSCDRTFTQNEPACWMRRRRSAQGPGGRTA